jgi:hypothetical protein
MSLRLLSFLGLIAFSVILLSCSNSVKGIATNENSVVILESFQTPIIRGVGQLKGMRIGIKAVVTNQLEIDSILFEGLTTTTSTLKTNNDTIWVDAFFYPKKYLENRTENTTEFSAKKCTVFYHNKLKSNKVVVSNLKLVTDHTMWK